MSSISELIIQSIESGDNDKALKHLYKDPLRKIRKYILQNSGSIEDADDVFQDALVVLFHYVKTGKYKKEYDLDGFLYRVAKNSWVDLMRKKQRMVKNGLIGYDIGDEVDHLDDLIKEEKLSTFRMLFNKLEENCRTILTYVIFDKKSMKEIAVLLSLKDDNVAKNQHYRCKKYFSKILADNQEALQTLQN